MAEEETERHIEQQIDALEGIFNWIDLDELQQSVIDAVGTYWADDINDKIAELDFEVLSTIRKMRAEAQEGATGK